MKRFIVFILIFCLIFILCGCTTQQVRISRNIWNDNKINVKIRENYTIAEDAYSIEEVENGYNIIIHCVKVDENEKQN